MQKFVANIFISYRASDSAGVAKRLADALELYFAKDQLFIDNDWIQPGADFVEAINERLQSCDIMLAVIGPGWLGFRGERDFRIQDANDWVRVELETALKRNIPVIPVLVDGARLPSQKDLPQDIHPLLRRQAYEITNRRWKTDTDNLINLLIRTLDSMPMKTENSFSAQRSLRNAKPTDDKLIFFSYSRADSEFALRLANDLKEAGKNIWMDTLNIRDGQTWDREIQKALKDADSILALLSESSVDSDNVLNEIQYAIDKAKNVIPIRITQCETPISLYRRQYIDFTIEYDKPFERLLKSLGN